MRRDAAFERARQVGARPRRGISRDTQALVVGARGWLGAKAGRPSKSLQRACDRGLPILPEVEFIETVAHGSRWRSRRGFSINQLSRISGLSVDHILVFTGVGLLPMRGNSYPRKAIKIACTIAKGLSEGLELQKLLDQHLAGALKDVDLTRERLAVGLNGEPAVKIDGEYASTPSGQYILFTIDEETAR